MKLLINAVTTRPGGALTVLVGLLNAWRDLGCDLQIAIAAGIPETISALRAIAPDRRDALLDTGRSLASRVWFQTFGLARLVHDLQADLFLTNNHYVAGISCPQIVHHHNLWRFATAPPDIGPARRGDFLRNWLARRALRHARANVFVSEILRQRAEQLVPTSAPRNHVIPNALPDAVVDEARARPYQSSGQPQLVAVQSANPHKDNPTLLATLAALVAKKPAIDWRLAIAGSAGRSDWKPFRRLAADLGIANRIDWLGFCSPDELRRLLRRSLCLVSTSVFESSGLTLIEALAEHCVPVASRIPANEEYAGRAALYAEPRHAEQFAAAILELYDDPPRRLRIVGEGLKRIENYRWSTWADRYNQLLQSAVL